MADSILAASCGIFTLTAYSIWVYSVHGETKPLPSSPDWGAGDLPAVSSHSPALGDLWGQDPGPKGRWKLGKGAKRPAGSFSTLSSGVKQSPQGCCLRSPLLEHCSARLLWFDPPSKKARVQHTLSLQGLTHTLNLASRASLGTRNAATRYTYSACSLSPGLARAASCCEISERRDSQ